MRVIRNVSAGDMLIEYGSYMPHRPPHPGLPSLLVIFVVSQRRRKKSAPVPVRRRFRIPCVRCGDLVFIVDLPPVSLLRYTQPPVTETMTIPFGVGINIVGVFFFSSVSLPSVHSHYDTLFFCLLLPLFLYVGQVFYFM